MKVKAACFWLFLGELKFPRVFEDAFWNNVFQVLIYFIEINAAKVIPGQDNVESTVNG